VTLVFTHLSTAARLDYVIVSSCASLACTAVLERVSYSGATAPPAFVSASAFVKVEFAPSNASRAAGLGAGLGFSAMWGSTPPAAPLKVAPDAWSARNLKP